jgi:hypothetical protein
MKSWKYRDRIVRRCWPGVACRCSPNDHTCWNRQGRSLASLSAKERRRLRFGGGGYEPAERRRERHNKKQREAARASRTKGAGS